jgi:ribosomal protein S18 acetylase RimI-like enzyme
VYTNGGIVQVRRFEIEDVAWASPLADAVFSALDAGYGEAVARWAADPQVEGWVAELDRPVGFVLAGSIGVPGGAHLCEILAIAVDPSARRAGIGRSLLAHALRRARSDPGLRGWRLTLAADNGAAAGLFTQAGFTVDRADDGTFPGGQRVVRMVRPWADRRGSGYIGDPEG